MNLYFVKIIKWNNIYKYNYVFILPTYKQLYDYRIQLQPLWGFVYQFNWLVSQEMAY